MTKNQRISVISFNAFGAPFYAGRLRHNFMRTKISLRFRKIGEILNTSGADVICLQEVHILRHVTRLKIMLTNYPYCVYKSFLTCPRGDLLYFKLPITQMEYIDFQMKGKYWNKSITGRLTRRGMLLLTLQDLPVTIVNTHLVQNSDHDWSETNAFTKLIRAQLADLIAQLHVLKRNTILAGDFNFPKDSFLYKELTKLSGMIDSFHHISSPTIHEEFLFGKKKVGRIDYILYKGTHVIKPQISHLFTQKETLTNGLKIYLSDHIGLKADFLIKKSV